MKLQTTSSTGRVSCSSVDRQNFSHALKNAYAGDIYRVEYSEYYQPSILALKKMLPQLDTRFSGPKNGMIPSGDNLEFSQMATASSHPSLDRCSYIFEIACMGLGFMVHNTMFLVSRVHPEQQLSSVIRIDHGIQTNSFQNEADILFATFQIEMREMYKLSTEKWPWKISDACWWTAPYMKRPWNPVELTFGSSTLQERVDAVVDAFGFENAVILTVVCMHTCTMCILEQSE